MNAVPVDRERRLKEIRRHVSRMPSLPTTVRKVLEICNDPGISPYELNRVISLDPVLTGQILGLVNSAFYSLRKKATSLTRAIILLGVNTVKNLALSTAVLQCFGGKRSFKVLSTHDFWIHSLCVGVTAKSLASIKAVPVTEREEYFIAGLMHDLGKIPLCSQFPDEYLRVLESARSSEDPLYRTENAILAVDHNMVGKMIAEKWDLGESLAESLFHHHDPDRASPEHQGLIDIVALANTFSNALAIGTSGDHFLRDPLVDSLVEKVGIPWEDLLELRGNVLEEIEKAKVFLQIAGRA